MAIRSDCRALALIKVFEWDRHYMTELEYHVASAVSIKACLLNQQKKLRIEPAKSKAPERIASIVMTQLQMTYPKREEIIQLKNLSRQMHIK